MQRERRREGGKEGGREERREGRKEGENNDLTKVQEYPCDIIIYTCTFSSQ